MRFTDWVQAQADRQDEVGELARRVPDWPRGRPRLDELHAQPEVRGADGWDMGHAHQALDEAAFGFILRRLVGMRSTIRRREHNRRGPATASAATRPWPRTQYGAITPLTSGNAHEGVRDRM
jgi:hypothetical protein